MKKIAFVNQRYGKEVNGGSEYYTMLMAEKLKEHYNVEILTSKALTYDKWENYYHVDKEEINGILVRRFGIKRKRNRIIQRILKFLITKCKMNNINLTEMWNKVLGPYVPDLVKYVHEHKNEYDVFIFVTYMYYPVVFGINEVKEKAIFVPTAHDEYCIYFKVYNKLFQIPKSIVYLTPEEREFVHKGFHNEFITNEVIGIGIDVPERVNEKEFRRKYAIHGEYIIYAGRVEIEKGCDEMFGYFQRLLEEDKELHLIVIGNSYMNIPNNPNIKYLGFISSEDKYCAIKGAKFLWLPSKFESLSIALLEAMALGTPVVVNGECEVLKGHCKRSGGGMWYQDYENFKKITFSMDLDKRGELGLRAKRYVEQNYVWETIITKWKKIIENI